MNSHLTDEQIKSLLTEKGAKAVADGFNLAICVNISEIKVGSNAYNPKYALKLHSRKLENYLQTLYQMNGQVNTLLGKLIHNYVAITELVEKGYLCEDNLELLLPKLMEKLELIELGEYSEFLNLLDEPKDFDEYYVIHYRGIASINPKDIFEHIVPDVKSGEWEGGCPREQIKALKKSKQAVKMKFYTKTRKDDSKVIVVDKSNGDSFTVFPSANFNHKKFSDDHRGMSFQEIKALVEYKYHVESDAEWFIQYETEVK